MRKRQFDLCDTPHPRYGCTIFPFSDPPCLSNGSHCSKCWCFFCEEAAPCSQWGSGIMPTDHCNAVASSWIWPTQKFAREEDPNEEHSVMALPPRPSSMSGLSHGLYGPNFYSLPLSTGIRQVDEQRLLHESSAESDCFSSCQSSLVSARPRTDPSTDAQWFEFGTVWIPIEATQPERTMDDLSCSMDKFSLEFFVQNLRENGMIRLYQDDSVEDFFFNSLHQTTHNYKGLLDEIILNEAQGQLQVILSFTSHPENGRLGMANVRIFLKKERGEELLILKELLREMFPHDFSLQQYLVQVEEMRIWAESSTEWMSFAGLLRDLDSADYRDAPQPSGLSVPLRPYQLQSLQFMLDAEQRGGGLLGVNYHPLQSAATGSQLMYSASLSHLMEYRQGNIHGGFLCEEMGLGKTIEILALILSNPCPIENSTLPSLSKGTLIVCPVSIVGQWANEVKSKLAANLSIYMYHGSKRIRDPKKLAKYDIVITTYATLGSDFSKATQATRHGADFAEQFCPLLSVNWWRVVLDESHTVKDPAPLHSRACARLKADRRWCCTGTPINTSIYDLYGQFLFLKMEPLDNKGIFKRRIGRPYERRCKNDDQTALLWTLNKIMIRHTKQQKFNGRELLRLPPKTEQDIPVSFTAEERAAYEVAYQKAIAKFEQFRCWGPTVVSKNILHIMSLLLPLRRLCSGGFISQDELNSMEKREAIHIGMTETISDSMQTPADTNDLEGECAICFELMECPTKTPCGHWFCCECIISTIGIGGMSGCPVCKLPITTNDLVTYSKGQTLQDPAPAAEMIASSGDDGPQTNGVHMESKLRTLLADLAMVREENEGAKVLIFSQFMQTIAWLRAEFKKQGINYRFISGDMPMKKRSQAIEAFQKDSPTTVFLLSIRTGAVGITLTAASHVYMLEPCLNPALEEQAVGRCWRMGQERPVVIKRLFVENSVEANIMKLIRSRNITNLPICAQDSESAVNRSKLRKNSIADVAGCIRTDKQNLRLSEFEVLFSCEK